ncbi:hypothetical protein NIIDMKKI_04820 [Mycobacterium kansasii]|uniref:Uncharacterized protein n=1 Tax=Mycobacterium kansasii TaxID=1768 RepID=A0A7G1I2L7_MYCKA|nr:hypothetical protein NIIDMKKI_04820 [Mycobacterium kansasii]
MVGHAATSGYAKIAAGRAPGPGSGPASAEPASLCMDANPFGAMNGFGGANGPNVAAARAEAGSVSETTPGTREMAHAASSAVGTANIAAGNRTKVPSRALGYRGFWRSRTTTRQHCANDFASRSEHTLIAVNPASTPCTPGKLPPTESR